MQNTTTFDILTNLENAISDISKETSPLIDNIEDPLEETTMFDENETFIRQYEAALLDLELTLDASPVLRQEVQTIDTAPLSTISTTISNLKSGI